MQEDNAQNATTEASVTRSLKRSRLAVYCIFAICVFVAGLSAVCFVYQVQLTDEFGDPYRNQPGAWAHLIGFLLKFVVSALLAWSLWRYLRAVRRSVIPPLGELPELFQALTRCWMILALGGVAVLLHGSWAALVTGPPTMTSRPLSRRFEARRSTPSAVKVEFRVAEASPHAGYLEANVVTNSQPIWMKPEPFITNEDIAEACVVQDYLDNPAVQVKFVPAGQHKLYGSMESNEGKLLAILIDGRVVTAPKISTPINGDATITGTFTLIEAERIAKGLSGRE